MKVLQAKWAEHKEISAVAKLSKFSKGFASGGLRYVDQYYEKGWVSTVRLRSKVVGFICVRHCTREPHTSVYYLGVAEKRRGIGSALIQEAMKQSAWKCLELISEKENEEGLAFYKALGFKVIGDGANSQDVPYWRLELRAK
jgi:ribosomal protein S18 acetylase RimI-like enzyme